LAEPGICADSSGAALTDQLSEEWSQLGELGAALADDEWNAPTPCPGWTVAAQFAHVIGTESVLLGRDNPDVDPGRPDHVRNDIGGFNEVWVAALASSSRHEVLERFAEVTSARRSALAAMSEEDFAQPSWTPVGKADYRRFMQIRVFDCWTHEQDIRQAVGRPGHDAGPVAEQSVDEIVRAIGYIVGKKAGAPAGSTVTLALTGPVQRDIHVAVVDGRARAVAELAAPATATLRLTSNAFTRLACGRVDPEQVLGGALGGIETSGNAGLARQVATNLAFTI
jgi:uncharacterized protein (TIGR03083 family)